VQEAGSITVQTRARPVTSTLSVLPFPLNRRPGWASTTVQVPAAPTEEELAATIGTLAEARRVGRELVVPRIAIGGPTPKGTALVLARPGAVPDELSQRVAGPRNAGVLTVSRDGEDVRVLAIGAKALAPLATGYYVGKVRGRTVEAISRSEVAIRVPDAQLVTGIERNPVPWRWPLIVLGAGILLIALVALQRTAARLRRRTQGAAPGPDGRDDGHPGA
jgi:hypothetical protein